MPFTNPGLFTATSVHLTLATKYFLSNYPCHFLQHGEECYTCKAIPKQSPAQSQ